MKIERRTHLLYKEWLGAKIRGTEIKRLSGRYQYILSNRWGEISVVHLDVRVFPTSHFMWEVAVLKKKVDVLERFNTKEEAMKFAKKQLTFKKWLRRKLTWD